MRPIRAELGWTETEYVWDAAVGDYVSREVGLRQITQVLIIQFLPDDRAVVVNTRGGVPRTVDIEDLEIRPEEVTRMDR